uniref:Uncharacterized protein n=1 Tax=Anser brachyrhynchus TaxID=132585 RepID=A0A8B9CV26_9AVES
CLQLRAGPREAQLLNPEVRPRLTHAGGQVNQDVVALQAVQELEQAAHGGPPGAAALPLVQQRPGGVGQRLQPPDLQVLAAQLLGQRRPVGGRGGAGVEVEAEAAPHAVVERHHGHGGQLRGLRPPGRARHCSVPTGCGQLLPQCPVALAPTAGRNLPANRRDRVHSAAIGVCKGLRERKA